jgi:hypothetical protein
MKLRFNKQSEKALSYFSVVITLIIVGLTIASYLKLVASQNQMTMRSQAWNRGVAVMEAGMESHGASQQKCPAAAERNVHHQSQQRWLGR